MKDKMEKEQQNINVLMVVAVSVAGTLCGLALVIYVCHLRRKLKAAQFYGKITYIRVLFLLPLQYSKTSV
jgi:NADH:ubiquinone oxidoreductase subunit K